MKIELNTEYFPWCAVLELTLKCNMRCLHCGSSAGTHRNNELSLNEWYRAIDELKQLGCEWMTLSGGEPFISPHWRDILKYIIEDKQKKVSISAVTNGTILNQSDIKFLKEIGMSHIGISLDGTSQIHDYLRQAPGSFKKIMNTIEMCKKEGLPFAFITSFSKINFAIRNEIHELIKQTGACAWQVQMINVFGRAGVNHDNLNLSLLEFKELVDDIARWQKSSSFKVSGADCIGYCHPVTDEILGEDSWQGCNAGKFVIGIESNGQIKGCLSLQSDEFIAGNIREKSIKQIWLEDKNFRHTRQFDESKMVGVCSKCDTVSICKGGCLAQAYSQSNHIYENKYCYKSIVKDE